MARSTIYSDLRMFIGKNITATLIFICSAVFPSVALSGACEQQAATALERVYCEVKRSPHGRSLPLLKDFRRNPEATQRLLLDRPAKRLGIALPAKPKKRAAKPAVQQEDDWQAGASSHALAKRCALGRSTITCDNLQFALVNNLPNQKLAPNALSEDNILMLPEFTGNTQDVNDVQRYLKKVYPMYLAKMLDIGLGASSMSYTKFYYTFQEVQKLKAPFAQRMTQMYEHLKKDKAAMMTQTRYGQAMPDSINDCMLVGAAFVVCDNVKNNWVFVLR